MPVSEGAHKLLPFQDLNALARAGKSWEFLAIATHVAQPDDALGLLISATSARLGLATIAKETAATLSPAVRSSAQGASLAAAIAKLPDDVAAHRNLEANVARNLAALRGRGIDLGDAFEVWRERASSTLVFRAADGGVVQRSAGSAGLFGAKVVRGPSRAQEIVARAVVPDEATGAPLAIADACPAWLLRTAFDATKSPSHAYQRRITIVEPDPVSFIDALALCDLADVLADERVEVLVGSDWRDRFEASLERRHLEQCEPIVLTTADEAYGGPRLPTLAAMREVITLAMRRQREEHARLMRATDAYYATLTPAYFRQRFADALERRGEPLRVLIPTCRFSTFVKHAAADLAGAFRRAGHIAEVLMEERRDSRLSELSYRDAVLNLKPDLVVLINYPRACMGNAFPKNVPYVCWVQDAMPHLFNVSVGQAQGPLDFILGHAHQELFLKYDYPIDRAMAATVVADAAKFHPEPIVLAGSSRDGQFDAEIAFVTHHSETPEAMHARLCKEAAKAPKYVQAFGLLFGDLAKAVENARHAPLQNALQAAVRTRLKEVMGQEPDARTETLVVRQYAGPMADRMLRHQTIQWAAGIAQRRGWRLAIHGRGWNSHATLSQFARGELDHGEDLRAVYQRSAATIHVAGSTLSHQRVFECFLSGGLCLSRMHREIVSSIKGGLHQSLLKNAPDVVDAANKRVGYVVADHPRAMAMVSALGAIGQAFPSDVVWISNARVESFATLGNAHGPELDATSFLRDLAETTFSSPEELDTLIERAIHAGAWRTNVSNMVAKRVREHLTHDALVRRMLGFLHGAIKADVLREAV